MLAVCGSSFGHWDACPAVSLGCWAWIQHVSNYLQLSLKFTATEVSVDFKWFRSNHMFDKTYGSDPCCYVQYGAVGSFMPVQEVVHTHKSIHYVREFLRVV